MKGIWVNHIEKHIEKPQKETLKKQEEPKKQQRNTKKKENKSGSPYQLIILCTMYSPAKLFWGPKKLTPGGVDFVGPLFFDSFTSPLSCFRERAAPEGAAREPKLRLNPSKHIRKSTRKQFDMNPLNSTLCTVCARDRPQQHLAFKTRLERKQNRKTKH